MKRIIKDFFKLRVYNNKDNLKWKKLNDFKKIRYSQFRSDFYSSYNLTESLLFFVTGICWFSAILFMNNNCFFLFYYSLFLIGLFYILYYNNKLIIYFNSEAKRFINELWEEQKR